MKCPQIEYLSLCVLWMSNRYYWSVYHGSGAGIMQQAKYVKVGSQEFFYGSDLWQIQNTTDACEVLSAYGFIRPVGQPPHPMEEAALWDISFRKVSGNDGPDEILLKRIKGRDFGIGNGIFELLEIDESGLSTLVRWNLIQFREDHDEVDRD